MPPPRSALRIPEIPHVNRMRHPKLYFLPGFQTFYVVAMISGRRLGPAFPSEAHGSTCPGNKTRNQPARGLMICGCPAHSLNVERGKPIRGTSLLDLSGNHLSKYLGILAERQAYERA